jgi:Xaa-Pro dipeptidase
LADYVGLEVHDVGEGGTLQWSTQSRPHKWLAAFDTMMEHPMLSGGSILQTNEVITIEPGM